MTDRLIATADDADYIREDVEAVFEGWFQGVSRIDWVNFLERLEDRGCDLGEDMLSPAIKRIKKIVAELRKQG